MQHLIDPYALRMFVGRGAEMLQLERMLRAAATGDSSVMILSGEPGIGKTSLLDEVVSRAGGFTVLRTQALETESELPFAGLSDLLRPVLSYLDRLPEPQAAVLSGALALGPPTPGDRFAAAAATIGLLAAAADDGPVLVLADDVQWLDTPSREALLFAAHRLGTEGVVMVIATRPQPWLAATRIAQLKLTGLPAVAAAELIASTGREVDGVIRERLTAETAGNPLALLEALATLSDEQLSGAAPILGPIAVGADLEQSFAQRLQPLSKQTRAALLVVAASETGDAHEIGRAISEIGLEPAALESAEREGVVAYSPGRVEFAHPLLRAAVYHGADPVDRRAAHRELAQAVAGDRPDETAWHLAHAAVGSDESVASLLEASASRAQERHGYAAAAGALTTSARLSPLPADQVRRTVGAAMAFRLGGQTQVAAELLAGVAAVVDPTARADAQLLRGSALLHIWPMMDVHALLVAEADLIEPEDAGRAAAMLSIAAVGAVGAAEVEAAVATAGRAAVLAQPIGGPVGLLAALAYSFTLALSGQTAAARGILEPLVPMLENMDPLGEAGILLETAAHALSWLEEFSTSRRMLERIIATARAASVVTQLPHPLAILSELEFRCGRLAAAYAAGTESVSIALETGETVAGGSAYVTLARVEAVRGLEADCRSHIVDALEVSRPVGAAATEEYAASVLGLLELSMGRPAQAVPHLSDFARIEVEHRVGLPNVVRGRADLVEALLRVGRTDDARRALETLETQASVTGSRWAAATAARCRGLLADEGGYESHFAQALELHDDQDQFEVSRTELCLGQRRRRSRRRADARIALRQALVRFESMGAEPWAEQARAELRATGELPASNRSESLTSLTPQELQVTLLVADGATNGEAAAALFISHKTVEFHLSNVYRKLGVRSRTELARRVSG